MKKVIIIGAGPAGLTAGYELLKQSNDYEVIILEESTQVGGISKTIQYKGNRMDIGGHRFFSKDESVMKWWNSILPLQGAPSYDDKILNRPSKLQTGGPDPEKEDRVFLNRRRISRIYYLKKFFDYPISMKWQTIQNLGLFRTMMAGFSYLFSTVVKKPDSNLENFYINRFGRTLYQLFFEGYTEKVWGRPPRDISAEWGAQRVKGLSIIAILKDIWFKFFPSKNHTVETSLIEEFWYPKFGPGHLWETVQEDIEKMGGKILLKTKVIGVTHSNNIIESVTLENNQILMGDIFISSMPIKDLFESFTYKPDKKLMDIATGLPYRDFITIGILVPTLAIKNTTDIKTINNIVPDCWIYIQDTTVKLGRIQIFNNWSPYLVADKNNVWVGLEYFCTEGDDFWNLSDEAAIEMAKEELVRIGVINNINEVLDANREKIKKAYPAYFDTYNQIDDVVNYLNQIENLYCVGRNGQHRYNNSDHSMVTSFETVKNILSNRKDKTNIWEVNTEKEYHEAKK